MMKREKVGGYVQNVFRLNSVNTTTTVRPTNYKEGTVYESLEKVDLPSGYVQTIVEKDYPITKESVTSFADGADYKNDPLQAIANAPQRVNLGDITQAQEFLQNPLNFARVYEDTKAKLAEYFAREREKQSPTVEPKQPKKEGE